MNRKLVLIAVIVLLVGSAGFVGYRSWTVEQARKEQERKAEVVSASRAVDDKLQEVWDDLELRDQLWADAVADPGGSVQSMLSLTTSDLEDLQKEIDDVRALVKKIPSKDVQKAYARVCDELDSVAEEGVADAKEAQPLCQAYDLMYGTQDAVFNGWTQVNDAIDLCNKREYSKAKDMAVAAQTSYQTSKDAYVQAMALCAVPEVEQAYAFFDGALQLAAMEHELATLGTQGKINSYNSRIDGLNEQVRTIETSRDLLLAAESAVWAKAESSYGMLESKAGKAHTMWDDARDLVSSGKV